MSQPSQHVRGCPSLLHVTLGTVVIGLGVWGCFMMAEDASVEFSWMHLARRSLNAHTAGLVDHTATGSCKPGVSVLSCTLQFEGLKSLEQYAHVARVRQQSFCTDSQGMVVPGAVKIDANIVGQKFSVNVYQGNDIVSGAIAGGVPGAWGGWENHEVSEVLWALAAPVPGHAAAATHSRLFLDIGANVGWFALAVAAHGYEVAAFEGMAANQQLIRSALCEQPHLMEKVTLYPLGLASKRDTCYLASETTNRGDGIAVCGQPSWEAAQATFNGTSYTIRSEMKLVRLDAVFQRSVKVAKIDVEGFEPFVIDGAEALLREHPIMFALIEYNTPLLKETMKEEGSFGLVTKLKKLGYNQISTSSFKGPWATDEELRALEPQNANVNFYCVHSSFNSSTGTPGRR